MAQKEKVYKIYRYWITLQDGDWNYVGQTTANNQSDRCGNKKTGSKYQSCTKFWTAIQRFGGLSSFNYEVLWKTTDSKKADLLEKITIKTLDSINHGFNISEGGHDAPGKVPSAESRKRQAEKKGIFGVYQFNKQGNLINKFSSIREAERQTGIFHGSISKCCSGKSKTAGGYIFISK